MSVLLLWQSELETEKPEAAELHTTPAATSTNSAIPYYYTL